MKGEKTFEGFTKTGGDRIRVDTFPLWSPILAVVPPPPAVTSLVQQYYRFVEYQYKHSV